jgi:hypothetical protein
MDNCEKLKLENKKLRSTLFDIEHEVLAQLKEMSLPCKYKAENINNQFPKNSKLQSIADAYNNSANTERLIYKQKLEFIKTLLDKKKD